ncbi:MAG: carboxymuconolactone decarboxylase family protein [Polyangiaceae bacterium]|nr:carboxymuconolactone decarboxylase family protein [Polyangiaceae bacterium]
MDPMERIRAALPEVAKDIKLNLQATLQGGSLSAAQRWGVAVASAAAARSPALCDALARGARREVGPEVIEDALAAATLMAMTNVYYRFRHMVGKPGYAERPARLRMTRLGRPVTSRVDLELFSLAASAVNGCETCVRAHEQAVLEGGLVEEQVHDAIRIAATVHAAAVALELGAGAEAEAEAAPAE